MAREVQLLVTVPVVIQVNEDVLPSDEELRYLAASSIWYAMDECPTDEHGGWQNGQAIVFPAWDKITAAMKHQEDES